MKLVCFPHYTAGGLLCDILQGKFSVIGTNNGINSNEHSLGKIGDSDTVYTDFDAEILTRKCLPYQIFIYTKKSRVSSGLGIVNKVRLEDALQYRAFFIFLRGNKEVEHLVDHFFSVFRFFQLHQDVNVIK